MMRAHSGIPPTAWLCVAILFSTVLPCTVAQDKPAIPSFEDHVRQANALFKKGELGEALSEAQAAAKLDPKRYEAPAAAALVLNAAKRPKEAKAAAEEALKLAPEDKREKVQELVKMIEGSNESHVRLPAALEPAKLTGTARRQFDSLMLIIEDADRATTDEERKKLLQEFLEKSEPFLSDYRDHLPVWTLRAVAAMELGRAELAWQAGQQMLKLGADSSDDPKTRKVLAMLDRKGLVGDQLPESVRKADEEQALLKQQAEKNQQRQNEAETLKTETARAAGAYSRVPGNRLEINTDGRVSFRPPVMNSLSLAASGQIVKFNRASNIFEVNWTFVASQIRNPSKYYGGRNGDITYIDEQTVKIWGKVYKK
jgi:tetratricopeptide (TPR) repeat protein